ncbi:DUF397 domain-containing protein [Actinomadura sp. 7K534]|uniref:DUF397 domain-containing protein n=1 Tax=Actinomadura sp. 7K534 TaxID=2530366 RepID=UPI0010471428|nr:DUF397 domain-containing protein [Actinomadura sp. 7K534]TDB95678.1 DUF397 domain-containing protein [Actinomadura sp. 7K534]
MNLSTELSRAHWRKARRSSSTGSDCVEVAAVHGLVAVRDSKNPDGPKLLIGRNTWQELTDRLNSGELNI